MTGIQAVDRKLVEVGRVYQLGALALIRRILVPAALPAWLTGVRGGLGLAWMFVIAAELMGASEGLGYLLLDGQMIGNAAQILGALVLFAILGKATDCSGRLPDAAAWCAGRTASRRRSERHARGRPHRQALRQRPRGAGPGRPCAVAEGEIVAVVGASGCGKSTLLRLVAGLEHAERGPHRASTAPRSPAPRPRSASCSRSRG